jgi:hypothetical protein
MKQLLALLAMTLATAASAHGPGRYYYHHNYHHGGNMNWVVPAVIGGAVVYGLTRPQPPQPVVVQPPVVYVPSGFPAPPLGYHYEQILDANCNCYRWVLVQG